MSGNLNSREEALIEKDFQVTKRVRGISEAQTLRMAARAAQLKASGRSIVGLTTGEPNFPTPENIKQAGIRAIQNNITKYTSAEGLLELREVIAEKFRRENNIDTSADRIQVSSGGKHALSNAVLTLVQEGDEVLIPTPYWVSYQAMAVLAETRTVFIPTTLESKWKFSADALHEHCSPRTKLLILNTPSNPTGAMYTEEDLRSFAPVIRENNLFVLVDELYEHLTFDGRKHFSIGSIEEIADRVITVNGLSKAYSMTGWRVGYATGPKPIIEAMNRLQSQAVSHPSSISQMAAIEALTGPQDSVETMRQEFKSRRDLVDKLMSEIPGIQFLAPEAAFYFLFDVSSFIGKHWPNGRVVCSSEEICEVMLEEFGVALVPGEAFGIPGWIRLSFSASQSDLREGVLRIKNALAGITE